jgi:MFS family permease
MSTIVKGEDLTPREKRMLFWASFFSLAAAGFGFSFRVAKQAQYGEEFVLSNQELGQVMGASFWPIAVTMIAFSLLVDRTGYKRPMYAALALQAASAVGTFFAQGYLGLYVAALCAGLGHGIIEAVINPICAAVYPKEKTKWLTILHAAWPAGLVAGTLVIIGADKIADIPWRWHSLWILAPVIAYGFMYRPCKFPVDERVQAGVPYLEMLKQVGFLSAALASSLLVYELGNQAHALGGVNLPGNWFLCSLGAGAVIGLAFGIAVKSVGKPLFFLLCCLMIPVATAELATDGWIKKLMEPAMENSAYALVFSASIMLVLRVYAGSILKFFTPPALMAVSGLLSMVGLFWLSSASGLPVFVAFVLYALGQTYYWPCILGFVAERYPQGGALTLNTVSAVGLLSFGIIGAPLLGVAFDKSINSSLSEREPAMASVARRGAEFLWASHDQIDPAVVIGADADENKNGVLDRKEHAEGLSEEGVARIEGAWAYMDGLSPEDSTRVLDAYKEEGGAAGRDVLKYAARFPLILVLAFGAIYLWFRSRGGYKPVELVAQGDEDQGPAQVADGPG